MDITVKSYNSNIEVLIDGYNFTIYHDACIDYEYSENLEQFYDEVSEAFGRELTQEEKESIEGAVMVWLSAHSN